MKPYAWDKYIGKARSLETDKVTTYIYIYKKRRRQLVHENTTDRSRKDIGKDKESGRKLTYNIVYS